MGRSIEKEITPRLNFLEYLHERGEFIPGEGVPQYVARQPFCLEMKLMELYSGAPPFIGPPCHSLQSFHRAHSRVYGDVKGKHTCTPSFGLPACKKTPGFDKRERSELAQ